MAQPSAKKGKGRGRAKSTPECTPSEVDGAPAVAALESTEEDIAPLVDLPELAGWHVEGGPHQGTVL